MATTLAVVRADEVHPDHLRITFRSREDAVRYRDAELTRGVEAISFFEIIADNYTPADATKPWAVVMTYVEDATGVRLIAIGCAGEDNAMDLPWCCRCPWCSTARREVAMRASERGDR